MKTLCLYYSRTNTTKEVMEAIAQHIGADLAEYTDGKDRSGLLGYVGGCFASEKNTIQKVSVKGEVDLEKYDRIIIGMPVWVERPCAIGRAFIKKYSDKMPSKVYYVVTHMAKLDYMNKIKALDNLLGRPSAGQVSIRTKENDYIKEGVDYAAALV